MKKLLITLLLAAYATCSYATLSTTYSPTQYNTDATNTAFNVTWGFFTETDVKVTYTDSDELDTVLTYGSGAGKYTIYAANADYESGGRITTGSTYPADGRITIERLVPYGQELSINGDFVPAKPLETQLDKLAAQTQQIKDGLNRTIEFPATDLSTVTYTVGNAEERAGKALGFAEDGSVAELDIATEGGAFTAVDTAKGLSASGGTISGKADDTSIEFDGTGAFSVKDAGITTAMLYDGDVTTVKIDDIAVTTAKLASDSVSFVKLDCEIDEDDMASNSATNVPTQQSVKAYVDAHGVVQSSYFSNTNQYAITTLIPIGNTTPLITEGDEVFSEAFTPTDSSSSIRIDITSLINNSVAGGGNSITVWADSTCIGATYHVNALQGNGTTTVVFEHTSGTTSAVTYSVRMGPSTGGQTLYVNRTGSQTPTFGGLMSSKLIITELGN